MTTPSCPPAQAFELAPSSPVVSGPPTTGGRPIEAEVPCSLIAPS